MATVDRKVQVRGWAGFGGPEEPARPGSAAELARFAELQRGLAPLFRRVFPERLAAQTVVVIPSQTMDPDELRKLTGISHYEERLLCLLMLLRRPRTRVVYVTSQPIPPAIVDYYLNLLPGVPLRHARARLTLLSAYDGSATPLTAKILERPRLLQRIRDAVPDLRSAHLTCSNATPLERTLALRLGIPLYATDPALIHLGSKSGSRRVFARAGIPCPAGCEDLRDAASLADALTDLRSERPRLRRAVVKLNDSFSGEGNALFSFEGAPRSVGLRGWIADQLPRRLRFEAPGETWEGFRDKLERGGGIAECWVEGAEKRSPSVQCRIDPLGNASVISTHDQVLGGASGQLYLGCTFPADPAYARDLHALGLAVAETLRDDGVIGRFGVDFVSTRCGDRWEHVAVEINLRKGGTTHPFLMLQFLNDGTYDPAEGVYRTPSGVTCCYYASDNLCAPAYRALTPDDLVDVAVDHRLHFDAATQQGVVFHLIGALAEFGKLGALCIGPTVARAAALYRETVSVLERESAWGMPGN